ncbi:MAG: tRNA lysidine(34) synthetase TilS [Gammaproteobacteria bacterium]|nr:tRNA lysidine(34) synthetase TilS [Gammaproteobacteria bacterium]
MVSTSSLEILIQEFFRHYSDRQYRFVLAFSGGLDSCVLLHLLQKTLPVNNLLAWHVHHGLLDCADDMALFCQKKAAEYRIDFRLSHLNLDGTLSNLESIARNARYIEFERGLIDSDLLLTAHHADDQVETFFLNLFRGSGSAGLRGIARQRKLSNNEILRPLLEVPRSTLSDYADRHSIEWFEDPSNQSNRFDRNYLRHHVIPGIKQRWPGMLKSIRRVCQIQSETQQILNEVAESDYRLCQPGPMRLDKNVLINLTTARQKNLILYWLRKNQLKSLPVGRLESLVTQLQAQHQKNPRIQSDGYEIRIYNDQLFIVKPLEVMHAEDSYSFDDKDELVLPALKARLSRKEIFQHMGIPDTNQKIHIGFRSKNKPRASEKHRLKRLFQKHRIPPWMRDRTPLVFIDGEFKDILVL